LLFIYTPFWNSPTGQTSWQIFALDGSNDVNSCRDVPFQGYVDNAPHLEGQIDQKPNF